MNEVEGLFLTTSETRGPVSDENSDVNGDRIWRLWSWEEGGY